MPKQRITKEMVVEAAFSLAREGGMEQVLVKNIAEKLECSVQPVYGYCKNMEGLKEEVIAYTGQYIQNYVKEHRNTGNLFRETGLAYARFAREEPRLYRLYFLRKREEVHSLEEIFRTESRPEVLEEIGADLGVDREQAKGLYQNLMIFNVGISCMLSSLGEHTNMEEMEHLLDGAYKAFASQVKGRQDSHENDNCVLL